MPGTFGSAHWKVWNVLRVLTIPRLSVFFFLASMSVEAGSQERGCTPALVDGGQV
jgi:hypothetical protein